MYKSVYQTPANMIGSKAYSHGQGRPDQSGCDFIERYSQGSLYASQRPAHSSGHFQMSQQQNAYTYRDHSSYLPQGPAAYHHGLGPNGPTLAPIRAPEHAFDSIPHDYHIQDAQTQLPAKTKDDVPTGGVAAHLDYDIDLMSEFVAEMAQGLVGPESRPTQQFYKYVSQVLSSTRLPSSTIILGLFYLASRMKIVSDNNEPISSTGTVYRMLTTCLLLGSKFLDDNTFQNRSWADVSNIPVVELNQMELEWLKGFNWFLHGPMHHDGEGFTVWREHWKTYEKDSQVSNKAGRTPKLAPLDTSVAYAPPNVAHPPMSPEGPIPLQYRRPLHHDMSWAHALMHEYSPQSASHSGSTTPDYYSSGVWSQAPPPPYTKQSWVGQQSNINYLSHWSRPPSYSHAASQLQSYPPTWKHFGPSAASDMCGISPGHYLSHHTAYGIQSVAG